MLMTLGSEGVTQSEQHGKEKFVKQRYCSVPFSFLELNLLLKVSWFLPLYLYTVIPAFDTLGSEVTAKFFSPLNYI